LPAVLGNVFSVVAILLFSIQLPGRERDGIESRGSLAFIIFRMPLLLPFWRRVAISMVGVNASTVPTRPRPSTAFHHRLLRACGFQLFINLKWKTFILYPKQLLRPLSCSTSPSTSTSRSRSRFVLFMPPIR